MRVRRDRLLDETLLLIRSVGLGGFKLNRLSERAGVALNTIYRTFGSRDTLIATAIEERLLARLDWRTADQPWDLSRNISRIICLVEYFRERRTDLQALTALHFSPSASGALRTMTDHVLREPNAVWAAGLDPERELQPQVDADALVADLVRIEFATLHDWAFGRISSAAMPCRILRAWLGIVVAGTRGETAREAERELRDLSRAGVSGGR